MATSELDGLRLTDGVEVTEKVVVSHYLGVVIDRQVNPGRTRALVLDLGLASGGMSPPDVTNRSPWDSFLRVPSRSVVLSDGVAIAAVQAFGHYCYGMWRWGLIALALAGASIIAGLPSLMALAAGVLIFFAVVLVHEIGHVLVYRLAAGSSSPGHLVSRGATCHLVRPPLRPWADAAVALGGPLAPLMVALLMLPVFSAAPVLCSAWWAVSLGHVFALVFPRGDGATLRSIVAEQRERRVGRDVQQGP